MFIESKILALLNTEFFMSLQENVMGTSLIIMSPILTSNRRIDVENSHWIVVAKIVF